MKTAGLASKMNPEDQLGDTKPASLKPGDCVWLGMAAKECMYIQ